MNLTQRTYNLACFIMEKLALVFFSCLVFVEFCIFVFCISRTKERKKERKKERVLGVVVGVGRGLIEEL